MKTVFIKMALGMLRDALMAALTAEKVDAVLDMAIDKAKGAAVSLLADYPELVAAITSVCDKAKEGQAVAETIVTTLNTVLDALVGRFGSTPLDYDAVPAGADLKTLAEAAAE